MPESWKRRDGSCFSHHNSRSPRKPLPKELWDKMETMEFEPPEVHVLTRLYPHYVCADSSCGIVSADRPSGLQCARAPQVLRLERLSQRAAAMAAVINDRARFRNNCCRVGCRLSHASHAKRGCTEAVTGFFSCPSLCVLSVSAFPTIETPGCMSGTLDCEAREQSHSHRYGAAPHDCNHPFTRYCMTSKTKQKSSRPRTDWLSGERRVVRSETR